MAQLRNSKLKKMREKLAVRETERKQEVEGEAEIGTAPSPIRLAPLTASPTATDHDSQPCRLVQLALELLPSVVRAGGSEASTTQGPLAMQIHSVGLRVSGALLASKASYFRRHRSLFLYIPLSHAYCKV